jgi:L-ribulose-5-phosphate 4-epimerase
MPHEIQQLKEQVCQANLELVAHGLVTITWGNASGRSADRSVIVIKPSGVSYDDLRPEHMVVVNVETGKVVEGKLNPSSDTPTHAVLYREFSGIGGIVHTHSLRATSFAQAGRPIPCFGTTHADHFHGEVPVTRHLTKLEVESAYELKTGEVIVERFASLDPVAVPAVLVAGHAPFTWGRDVHDAVKNAVALEAVAEMALATLTLQPDAKPLDTYLLEKHYRRKHGKDAYYGQQ